MEAQFGVVISHNTSFISLLFLYFV